MVGIINIKTRINNAEQLLESISEPAPNTKLYLAYGRVHPWANDAAPNTPTTSSATEYDFWRNMIGAKRITEYDVSHVIPRYNWTSNTRYSAYDDHSSTLFEANSSPFYIMTSEYNVYKCLSNNQGSVSTIQPTAINPNTVTQTADGYVWKYMYTVSASDQLRFMTNGFIPVKTLSIDDGSLQWDVQQGATDGSIYNIWITNGGTNYTNVSNLVITITGDGSTATATANINTMSNSVSTITMTNYGTGYTFAEVSITGGGGSGAEARAIISPKNGHGSDPVYELGGSNLMINSRLKSTEGNKLPIVNQYRQIAILKDVFLRGTSNISSNSVFSQTYDVTVIGSGADYVEDEWVYQGSSLTSASFKGRVVEYNSANSLLRLVDTVGSPTNDALNGQLSTASKFVTSFEEPELERFSGDLLYIDNFSPITRSGNQTESFQILLRL